MKKHLLNRILSLVLAAVMVLGLFPAVSAAPTLRWEKSDVDVSWDMTDRLAGNEIHEESAHKPTDTVRVSIVLEDAPTIKAGYSTMDIGSNAAALAYDLNLQKVQKTLARTISVQALEGKTLDVVWNLTLVSNIISANVPYGKIEAIKAVEGVKDVVIERQYTLTEEDKVDTNMYTSSSMIGSSAVWQAGYTGAGTRIAIIDTGTDTDHQSFANEAFLYALEQNAKAEGMSYEAYVDSLDLLDSKEIAGVLENLNVTERVGATAEEYYLTEKLPFAANYVDCNLVTDHDSDSQGSHGSHVAGIAAANRYIGTGSTFEDARESVLMSGVAPDAQIITLKVFGNAAGPFESDYFAAIEDAILLGCDSVNLSLGSGYPGTSENDQFAELLDYMATTDTVVVISAGNSGYWAESSATGYLYSDGVSFHTSGSPGTYTNSLAVASVDNNGTVGKYIQVGDQMIIYNESTGFSNGPMAGLDTSSDGSGTEYDYVFVDGYGAASDYAGIDLTGKIVFCSRGSSSFYEKGNVAAALGAAAVVIYNNTSGSISMDLTDYSYSAPCVSILQSEGAAVKAASAQQTSSEGAVYYTGKVTVSGRVGVSRYDQDYYTMSTFSSWGVPGSLEMKPEITAPGGMIWSVNGVDQSGSAYELMSGTSMAAPQVTGMAALVAEYIQENGLDKQTGLSVRHLAQSLLMSTAEPLREEASDGEYYSILNQGAGLARVDLATSAESYVLVDGMADGKVKVELGEDADRNGVYSFSFSINNLNGQALTYKLSADLFTQSVFDYNGVSYLDTWTRSIPADVTFSVNGVSLEAAGDDFECDLNDDGITNAADADYLLEYLVGNETGLKANGDLNGDGSVTSYDAHVLLTKLSGAFSVDIPANGSVTVEARLALTADAREFLDTYYPTGAYIEGFAYAEPVTDSEGVLGVTHSIPVLGYYGSWTEPSMYDVGSYLEYASGSESRTPYLYEKNSIYGNYTTINYGDGDEYLFGGNPFAEEAEYLPERNAFNNQNGYTLQTMYFSLIRNAAASMILVENADTGEVYLSQELGQLDGAYYHVNQGAWQNTQKKLGLGLGLEEIPEGTRVNVSLVTAPELYGSYNAEGTWETDWTDLAEGAYLTTSFTIDNTAPELIDVQLGENSVLNVKARDNEYIAAVAVMNASGTSMLAVSPANQAKPDKQQTVSVDLSSVYGSEFLVCVFDYAENAAVYEVTLDLDNERPYFTAFNGTDAGYVGMSADGTVVDLVSVGDREPACAAEYAEGYVFEISTDNILYVASDDDLYSFVELGELDPTGQWQILNFNDLAYNRVDGKLYSCFYSELNEMTVPYFCSIDAHTGEMTVLGEMPIDANSIAIDGQGNFYSAVFGISKLYRYSSDIVTSKSYTYIGSLAGYACTKLNSMAWDHNTNELYWAFTGDSTTQLLKVDPQSAAITSVNTFDFSAVGLYIAYEANDDVFAATDKVHSVRVTGADSTLINSYTQLSAQVLPWNISNGAVTWTSSDQSVATVDENGLVYGVSTGTAVITATSVLDSSKSASCTVTISALNKTLKGLVWDEEGQVHWASFNTDTIPKYESLKTASLPVNATMVVDGTLYASTLDTSTGLSDLYTVDPETFAMTYAGGSAEIAYLDMAYAPSMGYGLGVYFNYVVLIDLETGEYMGAWPWFEEGAGNLVGITYYGTEYNNYYSANMDYFLLVDSEGNAYLDAWIDLGDQSGYFYGPEEGYIAPIGDPVDYAYFQGFYYDGSYTYWTRFNEADNMVELIVWDCDNSGEVHHMGSFAEGVWPVAGLYSDAEINGTMALADEALTNASVKNTELMTDIPTVQLENAKADGSLNAVDLDALPVVKPMSKAEVADDGDTTVSVTMPAEGTNGTMTLTYDTSMLELVSVTGRTDAFAWKKIEDGKLLIAFADGSTLAKNTETAVLRFNSLDDGDTVVSASYGEWNDETLEKVENITVTLPHICPSAHFVDVDRARYYHEPVDYVVEKGYMNGTSATTFSPLDNMKRGAFVTVLYRMEGSPAVVNTGKFTDVENNRYYTDPVYWALETGITTGITATTFNPEGKLTRSQLVTFMYRYAAYKGYDTSKNADLSVFKDADEVPKFSKDAWNWAFCHGIITGVAADRLAPQNLTNRAQAATIFQRFDLNIVPGN